MSLPRVSVGRLMVLTAIIGFDCGLARSFWVEAPTREDLYTAGLVFKYGGRLTAGLAGSVGLGVALFAGGRRRWFAAGFTLTLLLAFLVVPLTFNVALDKLPWIGDVLRSASGSSDSERHVYAVEGVGLTAPWPLSPQVWIEDPFLISLVADVSIGIPLTIVSLVGGLLALALRPSGRPTTAPEPDPTQT